MTKHALNLMKKDPSLKAAIVNISSIEGIGANPFHAAYAASKAIAALHILLSSMANGIRCNSVAWVGLTPLLMKSYLINTKIEMRR